jgi:hypothetical protein
LLSVPGFNLGAGGDTAETKQGQAKSRINCAFSAHRFINMK